MVVGHGVCVKKAFHDVTTTTRGCSTIFDSSLEGCKHYQDDRYQGKTTFCFCHTEGCNDTPEHRMSKHVMLAAMALALALPEHMTLNGVYCLLEHTTTSLHLVPTKHTLSLNR